MDVVVDEMDEMEFSLAGVGSLKFEPGQALHLVAIFSSGIVIFASHVIFNVQKLFSLSIFNLNSLSLASVQTTQMFLGIYFMIKGRSCALIFQ